MLALSASENDLNTLAVVSLVMFVPWLFIAFALWRPKIPKMPNEALEP